MNSRTKSFTIRDGNGHLTTITIGYQSDDPFAAQFADAVCAILEMNVRATCEKLGSRVEHEHVVSPLRSASAN